MSICLNNRYGQIKVDVLQNFARQDTKTGQLTYLFLSSLIVGVHFASWFSQPWGVCVCVCVCVGGGWGGGGDSTFLGG